MSTKLKYFSITILALVCITIITLLNTSLITKIETYQTNKHLDTLVKYGKHLRFGPPATWGFQSVSKALGFSTHPETSFELVDWQLQSIKNICTNIKEDPQTWITMDLSNKAYSQALNICNDLIEKIDTKTIVNTDTNTAAIKIMTIALNTYSAINNGDVATRKHYGFSTKQLVLLTQTNTYQN